jgi:hypothetical protein
MSILTVGIGKDFTSLSSAVSASVSGDVILVEPGEYGGITVGKAISIIGNTTDIINDAVRVDYLRIDSQIIGTVLIEGLYVAKDNFRYSINIATGKDACIIINKCYILSKIDYYYYMQCPYVTLSNCTFGNFGIRASYYYLLFTERCINETDTQINIIYSDIVYNREINYGVDYGYRYFTLPTKYYFSGTVTKNGLPVEREVKAYRRDTDVLLSYTMSSNSGEYRLPTEYSGEHYIVCKDDDSGDMYNDIIQSRVFPVEDVTETIWDISNKLYVNISKDDIDSDLYNFPVVVKFGYNSGKSSYDTSVVFDDLSIDQFRHRWNASIGGSSSIYSEIIKWDITNREATIFLQIPFLSSSNDTNIVISYDHYMPDNSYHIGNSGSVVTSHLWSTDLFAVYHMNENPGGQINDSTYKRNVASSVSLDSHNRRDSQFGLGNSINFSSGYLESPVSLDTDRITVTAVIDSYSFERGTIFCMGGKDAGLEICTSSGSMNVAVKSSDYNVVLSSTVSGSIITVTAEIGGTAALYIDGEQVDSSPILSGHFVGDITIGSCGLSSPFDDVDYESVEVFFDGNIDEVFIGYRVMSEEWIRAFNKSINDELITYME